MYQTIEVLKTDIMRGKPADIKLCPIARAMKRAGIEGPSVYGRLGGNHNGTQFNVPMPRTAKTFMRRFDEAKNRKERSKLKPFSFRIKL